jgi:hypothetical protein
MKTPFRRLMLVFAITVLAVLTAFPIFAAPAPGVEFAVFELERSSDGALNVTKAVVRNNLELAIFLVNLPTDEYVVFKNNAALQTMRAENATQFADNEKSSATLRRGLVINTANGSYVLMAIHDAMNTEVPLPPTVLAHGNTKTGGDMFQINTMFDERAATLDQNPDGAWIVTR